MRYNTTHTTQKNEGILQYKRTIIYYLRAVTGQSFSLGWGYSLEYNGKLKSQNYKALGATMVG